MKLKKFSCLILLFLCLLSSCANNNYTGKSSLVVNLENEYVPTLVNHIVILPIEKALYNSYDVNTAFLNQMILNTTFQIENVKAPARVQNEYIKLIGKQSSVKSKIYFLGSALNVPAALGMDIVTNGKDLNKRELDAKVLIRFWLIDIKSGEVLLSAIYSSKNEALSNNLLRAREKFDSNLGVKSRLEMINQAFEEFAVKIENIRKIGHL